MHAAQTRLYRWRENVMARFSAMVIQQSQERLKKLACVADEVMQCGTSLAEDLVVSCLSIIFFVLCISRVLTIHII